MLAYARPIMTLNLISRSPSNICAIKFFKSVRNYSQSRCEWPKKPVTSLKLRIVSLRNARRRLRLETTFSTLTYTSLNKRVAKIRKTWTKWKLAISFTSKD